jgi:hypothetical protein
MHSSISSSTGPEVIPLWPGGARSSEGETHLGVRKKTVTAAIIADPVPHLACARRSNPGESGAEGAGKREHRPSGCLGG